MLNDNFTFFTYIEVFSLIPAIFLLFFSYKVCSAKKTIVSNRAKKISGLLRVKKFIVANTLRKKPQIGLQSVLHKCQKFPMVLPARLG